MPRFNHGEGYHSSEAVTEGKLRGATDTDYFYFFCPKCPDDEILRILDYEVRSEQPDNPYNKELNPKAERGFVIAFKLYCPKCGLTDFVKVGNMGWQGGTHAHTLRKMPNT